MKNFAPYFQLTKPTIMLLVIITGATALVIEGSYLENPLLFILVLVGLYLTGGSANALNQCFERDIDSSMERTRKRRPLPMARISPAQAFTFSIVIGLLGVGLFGLIFNLLSAGLALATILFYSLFYTLYLKPTTPQNIVIGGAAGAMAPVIAWSAVTGVVSWEAWLLFLIVFLWTPPHFWALALYYKEDYVKANLPMMPNVRGVESTWRQIKYYTIALIGATILLGWVVPGAVYATAAALLGVIFVARVWLATKRPNDKKAEMGVFGFSIVYLFGLFGALIVDGIIRRVG